MAPDERSVKVLVDGSELEVPWGSSLRRVLSLAGVDHSPGCILAVGTQGRKDQAASAKYALTTSKGEVVFEISDETRLTGLAEALKEAALAIQYADANKLSLGSFRCEGEPAYGERQLDEGEVFLDMAGMARDASCLILSKRRHRAAYSAIFGGTVGRVVAGQSVLKSLTIKDKITGLKPLMDRSKDAVGDYVPTSDLGLRIHEDGTAVFTTVAARLLDGTPDTDELLLRTLGQGTMRIDGTSGTFVSTDILAGMRVRERNPLPRDRGAITVRNEGNGEGRIYFFKKARPEAVSHTLVGRVERGAALLDLARKGDVVSVRLEPRRISEIGMTQASAHDHLLNLKLRHVRKGCIDDDAVVVMQRPRNTIDIMKAGFIETIGLRPERIVKVRLYAKRAPESVRHLLAVSGLLLNPIGSLSIAFQYSPVVGAVLMKGDSERTVRRNIPPENTPSRTRTGDIGITNSIKGRMGSIGVRIDPSAEFGPTCESLEGTNMVGKIGEDSLRLVAEAKDGEEVFIRVE